MLYLCKASPVLNVFPSLPLSLLFPLSSLLLTPSLPSLSDLFSPPFSLSPFSLFSLFFPPFFLLSSLLSLSSLFSPLSLLSFSRCYSCTRTYLFLMYFPLSPVSPYYLPSLSLSRSLSLSFSFSFSFSVSFFLSFSPSTTDLML